MPVLDIWSTGEMTPSQKEKWFGVKTLYRTRASGRPHTRDRHYDPEATLIEERIVLIRATDFGQALKAAKREALRYGRKDHENLYGQRVQTRFLGVCDAFELFDPPGPQREVYSRTELVSRRITNAAVVKRLMGSNVTRDEQFTRRKFVNRTIASKLWPDL